MKSNNFVTHKTISDVSGNVWKHFMTYSLWLKKTRDPLTHQQDNKNILDLKKTKKCVLSTFFS